MLSTTARTSCGSTAASSLKKRASGDAAVASAVLDELMRPPPLWVHLPGASRYLRDLLAAKLFVAPPDEGADAAPQHAGTNAERRPRPQAESGADQAGLHPGRGQIPEAIEHRVDDVLGFVTAHLRHDREADLAARLGHRVLRYAADDLHHLDHQQRGADDQCQQRACHDERIEQ